VPALGVVAETMMALVLANEALRKLVVIRSRSSCVNHDSYVAHLGSTASHARTNSRGRLVLVGLPGTGKTTVARELGRLWTWSQWTPTNC